MGSVGPTMDLQREHETPLCTHHLCVLDRTQRRINHLLPLRVAKVTEHWTLERELHRSKAVCSLVDDLAIHRISHGCGIGHSGQATQCAGSQRQSRPRGNVASAASRRSTWQLLETMELSIYPATTR